MDGTNTAARLAWDAYAVWQILLHRHPLRVDDPSGSCGHIDGETRAEFCETIADYPDFLQDALLVIAHAEGCVAAMEALDAAIRQHLAACCDQLPAPVDSNESKSP
jgi:hypothetical protein